jgi:predicted nucleic-acid-binding Zn-ribbon protein
MKDGKCPKCRSDHVIPGLNVYAHAQEGGGSIYVQLKQPEPEKRPFIWKQDYKNASFQAWVCGECGYTEYYAVRPADMLEAHKKGYKTG